MPQPQDRRLMPITTSLSSTSRKYLGDLKDPHFVPRSPIISRQELTPRQEDELRRSCSLALLSVQTADEVQPDSLQSRARRVNTVPDVRKMPRVGGPSYRISEKYYNPSKELPPCDEVQDAREVREPQPTTTKVFMQDSATPSDVSKRETLSSDRSTPFTTPGLSPQESTKRLSTTAPHAFALNGEQHKPKKDSLPNKAFSHRKDSTTPDTVTTKATHSPLLEGSSLRPLRKDVLSRNRTNDVGSSSRVNNVSVPLLSGTTFDAAGSVQRPGSPQQNYSARRFPKLLGVTRRPSRLDMRPSIPGSEICDHSAPTQNSVSVPAPTIKKSKFSFGSILHFGNKRQPAQGVVMT